MCTKVVGHHLTQGKALELALYRQYHLAVNHLQLGVSKRFPAHTHRRTHPWTITMIVIRRRVCVHNVLGRRHSMHSKELARYRQCRLAVHHLLLGVSKRFLPHAHRRNTPMDDHDDRYPVEASACAQSRETVITRRKPKRSPITVNTETHMHRKKVNARLLINIRQGLTRAKIADRYH